MLRRVVATRSTIKASVIKEIMENSSLSRALSNVGKVCYTTRGSTMAIEAAISISR
jgi:hypothetical protein